MHVGDCDITETLRLNDLILKAQSLLFKSPDMICSMTASHAARLIHAMVNDSNETMMAPGPNGMAGSLPVRVNSRGVEIELPSELSITKVKAMFNEGMRIDGIEKIQDNGTMVFSTPAIRVLRDVLSIDRKTLSLSELHEMNAELIMAYERLTGVA